MESAEFEPFNSFIIYRNSTLGALVCTECRSSRRCWQPGAFSQFEAPAILTFMGSIIVRAVASMLAFISNPTTCCLLLTSRFCICNLPYFPSIFNQFKQLSSFCFFFPLFSWKSSRLWDRWASSILSIPVRSKGICFMLLLVLLW